MSNPNDERSRFDVTMAGNPTPMPTMQATTSPVGESTTGTMPGTVPTHEGTMMQAGTINQGASAPAVSVPTMNTGPELPPQFELMQEIARGGMGVVYKAKQKGLDRVVALKMILPQMLYDNMAVERFYIEARAAAALDHPNIVPIHEVGEYKGQHFFTMAFIEGESLRHRIKRQRPTIREAVKLLIGIADGVGYAHQRGIIHRDMKPDNVLLDKQNRPRVTDFGLAKQTAQNSGLTATGQVMGTPSFMSPEQALGGKRVIGPQTDVYALGAILYNMLTGEMPFDGDSVTEVLCKVISETAPSIRLKNADIPESLEAIYIKAMAKDPAHRYADAAELRDALVAWEESPEGMSSRADMRPKSISGDSPFQPTLLPTGASFGSLPNATSPAMVVTAPAPAPTPGKPAWLFPVLGVLFVVIAGGLFMLLSGDKKKDATKVDEVVDNSKKAVEMRPDLGKLAKEIGGSEITKKIEADIVKKVEADLTKKSDPPANQGGEMFKVERQDFKLKVEFLKGEPGLGGVWKLKKGDLVSCRVTSEIDCHVGVWSVDADGTVTQLFPNDDERDDNLKAGEPRVIPGEKVEIQADLSHGVDQLLVIGSNRKWDFEQGGKEGPFNVFKEELHRERFKNATRGLSLVKEARVSQEVIPFKVEKRSNRE